MRLTVSILLLLTVPLAAQTWRSALYPEDWQPPSGVAFNEDQFLQDFSYAGYRYSEVPLPYPTGPVYDVVAYGADASGQSDSTTAIQDAIDAAVAAGGGVVYLPEGFYRVAPPSGENAALLINGSHVVFRGAGVGKTFLFNTSWKMRSKAILRVDNGAGRWMNETSTPVVITQDLLGPAMRIPVASLSDFAVGQEVVLHIDATPEWIAEHQMDTSQYWLGAGGSLRGVAYFREIVDLDLNEPALIIDTPTRYAMKMRDNARVYRTRTQLTEVGIEDLSISNIEHPDPSGWDESDYTSADNGSYDAHASWLINYRNVRHGWIRRVHSFAYEGNALGSHKLSNGILLSYSRNITVRDCDIAKAHYGGGGGNGYSYRFQDSQDNLLMDSAARYQRHGIVQSHMRNSGNVYHRVLTQETTRQTAGDGSTSGRGSDHHMHFSQSNLFDLAVAERDVYDAAWRGTWGSVAHGLTATQSTYWNTYGASSAPGRNYLIKSDQYGYGFVIGTSGPMSAVENPTATFRTSPADYVEGVGEGATLEPQSLYRDQLQRRTGKTLIDPVIEPAIGLATEYVGASALVPLSAAVIWNNDETEPRWVRWRQIRGPAANIVQPANASTLVELSEPATYCFALEADNGYVTSIHEIEINLASPDTLEVWRTATADTFVRGGDYQDDNYSDRDDLWVKFSGSEGFQREAYLRFPTDNLPEDLLAARIEMTVTDPGEGQQIHAFLSGGDWEEETMSWRTKPDGGATLSSFDPQGVVSIPVPLSALEGDLLHVGLRTSTVTSGIARFASREDATPANRPRLVLVTPAEALYPRWARAQFGNVVDNPTEEASLWGDTANPDGDATPNLLEAALGMNPLQSDALPLILERDGTLVLRRPVEGASWSVFVEVSTDLIDWQTIPLEGLEVSTDETGAAILTYRDSVATDFHFVRLRTNPSD